MKRLYLFTGKGGVGKTTLALSAAKYLSDLGKEVEYIHLRDHSLLKDNREDFYYEEFSFPQTQLKLEATCREYIQEKLNSELISKFIVSSTFFRSLLNILPGFMYLIYLGKIVKLLNADPNKIIVLDSPASGHFITMMESIWNFNKIFGSGSLFKDTTKIIDFFSNPNNFSVNIISLGNTISSNESCELCQHLTRMADLSPNIILNNCFSPLYKVPDQCDSSYIKNKIETENKIIQNNNFHQFMFPYSLNNNEAQKISELSKHCEHIL